MVESLRVAEGGLKIPGLDSGNGLVLGDFPRQRNTFRAATLPVRIPPGQAGSRKNA